MFSDVHLIHLAADDAFANGFDVVLMRFIRVCYGFPRRQGAWYIDALPIPIEAGVGFLAPRIFITKHNGMLGVVVNDDASFYTPKDSKQRSLLWEDVEG